MPLISCPAAALAGLGGAKLREDCRPDKAFMPPSRHNPGVRYLAARGYGDRYSAFTTNGGAACLRAGSRAATSAADSLISDKTAAPGAKVSTSRWLQPCACACCSASCISSLPQPAPALIASLTHRYSMHSQLPLRLAISRPASPLAHRGVNPPDRQTAPHRDTADYTVDRQTILVDRPGINAFVMINCH